MTKKLTYLIIIIIFLIIAVSIFLFVIESKQNSNGCNYNDPAKSYIKKGNGCIINFLCTQDREAFSDNCGCGCKLKTG